MSVRVYIEKMKSAFGVRTDAELATKLGLKKQSIVNWRRRDRIPTEISEKMTKAFGSNFAYSETDEFLAHLRDRSTISGATYFFFLHNTRAAIDDNLLNNLRTISYLFPEVEQAVKRQIEEIGFEYENATSMLDILVALIRADKIPDLKPIKRRLLASFEQGPQWGPQSDIK